MNPELHEECLEGLLSLLLEQKVKIHQLLPHESARIADEYASGVCFNST